MWRGFLVIFDESMRGKKHLMAMAAALSLVSCSSSVPMCGGYSEPRRLSDQDRQFFESNYRGEIALKPRRVATQVVAGLNYAFTCKAENGDKYQVIIYEPLLGQGNPEVSSVTKL